MTRDEVNTAAWMVALNQVDRRSFPEMRGAFPELRRIIDRILNRASAGLGDLGDGIFDAISGAINAATNIYTSSLADRTAKQLEQIKLQMAQAQANAATQIAASNASVETSANMKTIALVAGGLGAAGLLAWWFFGRRSRR